VIDGHRRARPLVLIVEDDVLLRLTIAGSLRVRDLRFSKQPMLPKPFRF
jgi:hypothetical protein